jgi:RecA-family ATPase
MAEPFQGKPYTFRLFIQQQEEIDWLIDRLLPNVGWTLLVGKQGIGKTTLALQMCHALQEGKPFLRRHTKQCKVLFIQMDSPTVEWREICRRVVPESKGWTLVNAPMYVVDNSSYIGAMADLITKVHPGFVVWDSLYRLSQKNKINTDSVLDTIQTLNMLCPDIPYMLLHHPPQNELRASGHNSLGATASNEWHLAKNKLIINKGRLVEDKEILIYRAEKTPGLWYVKEEKEIQGNDLDDYIKGSLL